jgi:hypothetical protein
MNLHGIFIFLFKSILPQFINCTFFVQTIYNLLHKKTRQFEALRRFSKKPVMNLSN